MSIPPNACPFRLLKCASQSHKQAAAAGSVLLAVLCLLAVLSFLIITTAAMSREHGEMQQARTSMMRVRQLAESGVAVAAHPLIKAGDPLLRNSVSGIESLEARLTTEARLLNLNALLTAERLPLLESIFMSWGLIKCLVGSTNKAKERRGMMIFVQPRILPDSTSHFLAQPKFGDYSANFDEAAQFAGMPETIVPRAIPVKADKPNALLPPPESVVVEPKKGFSGQDEGVVS